MKYLIGLFVISASMSFGAEQALTVRITNIQFDGRELAVKYVTNHGGDIHRPDVDVTFTISPPDPRIMKAKVVASVIVRDFWTSKNAYDAPHFDEIKVDLAELVREKLKEELKKKKIEEVHVRDVEIRLPSVSILEPLR